MMMMNSAKVAAHLNGHRIDQKLLPTMEIRLHLDSQIFDEEIAKA